MCVDVYNLDAQEYAHSVKQFAEMIGLDTIDVPFAAEYEKIDEDGCLCQIDVEKACEIAGISVELSKDFDKYYIRKPK